MTSIQLYESATGIVQASGAVTLTLNGPRFNRTWQGTVTVLGAPSGSEFTVNLGAQNFGVLYAPGPAGPFQLLTGQNLQLTATLATTLAGSQITMILSGVNDPADRATPYVGPSIPGTLTSGSSISVASSPSSPVNVAASSAAPLNVTTPVIASAITSTIQLGFTPAAGTNFPATGGDITLPVSGVVGPITFSLANTSATQANYAINSEPSGTLIEDDALAAGTSKTYTVTMPVSTDTEISIVPSGTSLVQFALTLPYPSTTTEYTRQLPTSVSTVTAEIAIVKQSTGSATITSRAGTSLGTINLDQAPGIYTLDLAVSQEVLAGAQASGPGHSTNWHFVGLRGA